ncbi:hypothetical protein Tco_0846070 [Tanacetum coccineum]
MTDEIRRALCKHNKDNPSLTQKQLQEWVHRVPNPAKINVLDAMNLAISAWTMDVSANTIANCLSHCKLRSTDNMTFENSDEGGESTQELQNLIKRVE